MSDNFSGDLTDEIEILDAAQSGVEGRSTETLTSDASRGSALAVVAAVAVAALGIAGLAANGPDETTAPTTSSSTTPDAPTTVAEDSTTEAPGADRVVAQIGAGPELVWERVEVEVDATVFRWVEDSFVGASRLTDYSIRPNRTLTVSVGGFSDPEPEIQSSSLVVGDGTTNPSELVFPFSETRQVSRVTISPMPIAQSDLVEPQVRLAVERIDERTLVLQTAAGVLNVDQFRAQTGIVLAPIFDIDVSSVEITAYGDDNQEVVSIADLELSEEDLAALQTVDEPRQRLSIIEADGTIETLQLDVGQINWLGVINDEFIVGAEELRRSADGRLWEPTSDATPRFGGLRPPGPDGVLFGLAFDSSDGFITTSTDVGRTWRRYPRPMNNIWTITSVSPVIAATGWRSDPAIQTTAAASVVTADFELRFTDDMFELSTRDGTILLSGDTGDPASGFRFHPGSSDIWFVDPATGEEVARFDRSEFTASLATSLTLAGDVQLVGFADVGGSDGNPEWSLTPVNELFGPDALSVEFVPGDGWFLANVITTAGRQLYIAEVPTSRLPSSSRHPTHPEMSQEQGERD